MSHGLEEYMLVKLEIYEATATTELMGLGLNSKCDFGSVKHWTQAGVSCCDRIRKSSEALSAYEGLSCAVVAGRNINCSDDVNGEESLDNQLGLFSFVAASAPLNELLQQQREDQGLYVGWDDYGLEKDDRGEMKQQRRWSKEEVFRDLS